MSTSNKKKLEKLINSLNITIRDKVLAEVLSKEPKYKDVIDYLKNEREDFKKQLKQCD